MNSTARLLLLNGLTPGTGATERVGMKVTIKSIEIRFQLQSTPTTGVSQFGRFILVLDRQPNGIAPGAVTDILSSQSTGSPRNLANRKRFKIMLDKVVPIGSTIAGVSSTPDLRFLKYYLKPRKSIVTEYNTGVTGNIADISTNSLYFVYFGTELSGATDILIRGTIRIRYVDV